MRGSDGKRFDARVPLGRHFPLSRDIRGFFDPTATTGRRGVDGGHFSGSCRLDEGRRPGGARRDGSGYRRRLLLLAHVARPLAQERALAGRW